MKEPLFEVPKLDEMSVRELKELEKVFKTLRDYCMQTRLQVGHIQSGRGPCAASTLHMIEKHYNELPEEYQWKTNGQ